MLTLFTFAGIPIHLSSVPQELCTSLVAVQLPRSKHSGSGRTNSHLQYLHDYV